MDKNFDIDDILSEIKRKKSQNIAGSFASTGVEDATRSQPSHTPPPSPPPAAARPTPPPAAAPVAPKPEPVPTQPQGDMLDMLRSVIDEQTKHVPSATMDFEKPSAPKTEGGFQFHDFEKPQQSAAHGFSFSSENLGQSTPPPQQAKGGFHFEPKMAAPSTGTPVIPFPKGEPEAVPDLSGFHFQAAQPKEDFTKTQMHLPKVEELHPLGGDDGLTKQIDFAQYSDELSALKAQGQQEEDLSDLDSYEPKGKHFRLDDEPKESRGHTEIDDFNTPEDAEDIENDIFSIRTGLYIKFLLTSIAFVASLYLALSYIYPLPLPRFIFPEEDMRMFMMANTVFAVFASLVCSTTVGGGLLALFKLQADSDSLPALAMVATVAQGIAFIAKPDAFMESGLHLFYPVAILGLVFNLVGKIMMMNRVHRNFKLVSSDKPKKAVVMLQSKEMIRELTRSMNLNEYLVAYATKTRFLSHYLSEAYTEDQSEIVCRLAAPICAMGALVVSVLTYFFHKDIFFSITTFAAILSISAPFSSTIAACLPLARLSKKLAPKGAYLAGYGAVSEFAETECVIVNATDLFKPENVTLHGIKAFQQSRIDEAILDAASVICSVQGTLTNVFMQIIGNNTKILKRVDSIVYEDSMGLSAWVDGKRVLIGNRELMMNHGIELPSKDYEARFVRDSRNIIYLANSGELTSMFVISYNPGEEMLREMDKLADKEIHMVIYTSDPNITAEKISDVFDYPYDLIKIMPAKAHAEYEKEIEEKPAVKGQLGVLGKPETMLRAISACSTIKLSVMSAIVIQMIAVLLGYGLVTFIAFMGTLSKIGFISVLLYQLFWTLVVMVIPNLKKI